MLKSWLKSWNCILHEPFFDQRMNSLVSWELEIFDNWMFVSLEKSYLIGKITWWSQKVKLAKMSSVACHWRKMYFVVVWFLIKFKVISSKSLWHTVSDNSSVLCLPFDITSYWTFIQFNLLVFSYISCNPESLAANAIELDNPSADKTEKGGQNSNRGWKNMSSAGAKSMPYSEPFKPVKAIAMIFFHTLHIANWWCFWKGKYSCYTLWNTL